MNNIAELIKYKCRSRGINRQRLCAALRISESTLYNRFSNPATWTLGEMKIICKLTGMRMEDFEA